MILYFIRHGETDWNASGRLQGQMDIPLNDKGRVQAVESAIILQHLTKVDDLDYWSSPLARTRETMERLREALGLHPPFYKTDDRLKELTFGEWEGFTLAEAKLNNPIIARKREQDKWNTTPPKGESYQDVANRLTPWLNLLTRNTAVVSHGGVGRVLLHLVAGLPKHEAAEVFIKQGVVYQIEKGIFNLIEASS
jgi:broad specificity phosphatase PhoE